MKYKYLKNIVFVFLLFSISCNISNKNQRSLYIWNAELSVNQLDIDFFEKNKIDKLYIRMFDVEWTNKPEPISILNFSGNIPSNIQIIPVVYIKNEVLKNIQTADLQVLSENIYYKINQVFSESFINHNISEIQIDCDWTETSRDKYFEFLNLLKQTSKKELSVTIRLHQIKYQQSAGIPPVNKGVLMYYNMGDVTNPYEINSIINNDIGKQYINKNSSYPIKLSLALPVYSWSLWYDWTNDVNVLYSINVNSINDVDYVELIADNVYKVTNDTVIDEQYLRVGDKIRLEAVTLNDLLEAKKICEPVLHRNNEIILYSYKIKTSNLFKNEILEQIFYSD
ncbi:MAG: hypothetical protein JXR68_10755 [Bacteroidales bacterium]|nr:hypothetical protein [Bacteroidales bacterium]